LNRLLRDVEAGQLDVVIFPVLRDGMVDERVAVQFAVNRPTVNTARCSGST
jgi:hypothetical protein